MLTAKKLVIMVRKWQKVAALGSKRRIESVNTDTGTGGYTVARKGHIYVYTNDQKRFMVPLKYLSSSVFVELLRMSEEEYGLPSDGPIILPCDAACMESVISSITAGARCTTTTSMHQDRQFVIYGF